MTRQIFMVFLAFFTTVTLVAGGKKSKAPKLTNLDEYSIILQDIKKYGPSYQAYRRLEKEVFKKDALILSGDKTPIDVVLRRTRALIRHLSAMDKAPDLSSEKAELTALAMRNKSNATNNIKTARSVFADLCKLRRRIAFKNPLLDFDKILFLKHHKQRSGRGEIHMVDQYLGFNQKAGGGVFVLENPFSDQPVAKDLLAESNVLKGRLKDKKLVDGAFIALELDYDAQTIAFAYTEADHSILPDGPAWDNQRWTHKESRCKSKNYWQYHFRPESTFHIFKAKIDGSGLTQLTDGMYNEYDPCFMPDGRMIFISERTGGAQRCGSRALPTATLHAMEKDGSDLITLSWHDTNEWHPSIDNKGMVVYTRWDYIDRDSDIAHHLWFCYPDGRDPRSIHGNYPDVRESRPWMELAIRAIPGSDKYIAVAAPHHGENYGSLVIIDQKVPDNRSMSQVKRITPEVLFPESESAPGIAHRKGTHRPRGEVYGTPWPLSEDFYLCVYDVGQTNYGIYLVDSFGNRELLYKDKEIPCLDPIPLKSRKRPPVIPSRTNQAKRDQIAGASSKATVAIMNVYEAEFPMPKDTKIKELRVVAVFPKWNSFSQKPKIGYIAQALARGVLGTVPVEADGSVYFECPTEVELYFQLLDEKGQAVQTMRSGTYLHPGEQMSCIGCHESKYNPPANRGARPVAMTRAPSKLKKEAVGSYPLTFPRLVQPVLDKHCVSCHAKEEKAFPLDGGTMMTVKKNGKSKTKAVRYGWSNGYDNLTNYGWGMHGGNGALIFKNKLSYSIPGKIGAKASKLLPILEKGHHDVKLSAEELRRITLWLDCNSVFYGAYSEIKKQTKGEVVMPKVHTMKPVPKQAKPGL